jgi:hypothetical protein
MTNMRRLEKLVAELPEAVRVDLEEWGDHPPSGCAASVARSDYSEVASGVSAWLRDQGR